MNQIKNAFLKKKSVADNLRHTFLLKPADIRSVLIISNSESKSLKRKVEEQYPDASVFHLYPREIKEDRTVGFYYSVHKSDFNLTGALKNDKLKNLQNKQVDLLLDLSSGSEQLNYFVGKVRSGLKLGDMNSSKSSLYDFMIEFQNDEIRNVENIYNHLMIFTQHAN